MNILRFGLMIVLVSVPCHQPLSIGPGVTHARVREPLVIISGYSFTRQSIRKESRNDEARTVLKVVVSASPVEVLANATVTVSITPISGEALLYYSPGKDSSKLLDPGNAVELEFEIRTDNGNTYTGPVQFRLLITDVVNNDSGKSISAGLMLAPEGGLATAPPDQVLQIVP